VLIFLGVIGKGGGIFGGERGEGKKKKEKVGPYHFLHSGEGKKREKAGVINLLKIEWEKSKRGGWEVYCIP